MPKRKQKRFDKKAGVEFKLMYRHHTDPLYYDPTASGRILVPVTEPTDKDKLAIIESVPAEDRGEILNDEEYAKRGYGLQGQESAVGKIGGADLKQNLTALVESDQVAAAAKRHDLKLQHAIEKQIDKKKAQGVVFKEDMEVYDEEDDEEGDDGSDVEGEDSEERYMARAAKAERRKRRELEENGGQERLFEESYDSEVEEVFFGRQKKPKSERKEGDAGKKKKKGEEENGEKKEAKPEAEAVSAPKEPKNRKGVQVFDLNDFSEPLEDVDQVLKKAHLYKPADGVRYTEYDPQGRKVKKPTKAAENTNSKDPKKEEDWRKYIAPEGDDVGFEFFPAPEESLKIAREILAKQAQFKGGRKDVDIEEEDMNEEEHAVFEVLDGSDVGDDEVDDDFIAMLNDGRPALELIEDEKDKQQIKAVDGNAAAENAGVIVLKDEPGEEGTSEHPMMIENYKERMANVIQMLEKQEEFKKEAVQAGQRRDVVDAQARSLVNQKQYDDVFAAYMEKEYKDEQIGDLEGDRGVDPLAYLEELEEEEAAADPAKLASHEFKAGAEGEDDQEYFDYGELTDGDEMDALEQKQMQDKQILNEVVDEFIQDKKLWFRGLHQKHGEDIKTKAMEKGGSFLPGTALYFGDPKMLPVAGELDEEQEKQIAKERTLEQRPEESESDQEAESSEDSAEQWDAETILTTYTNTDNHPNLIKYVPKVKPSQKLKIELHKQFKVPLDGLDGLIPVAEEIIKQKKPKKKDTANAFEEDTTDAPEEGAEAAAGDQEEEEEEEAKALDPRKAAKKEMKAERRERRKQKKELKVAFSQQKGKLVKQQTAPHVGAIRPGVSQKKIY